MNIKLRYCFFRFNKYLINRLVLTIISLLVGFSLGLKANTTPLKIYLLTYSPGEELYSSFGHSALRVVNEIEHTDNVYNYGTFDFDTPGFYPKFIRGKLPYRLSRVPTSYVIENAKLENRTIVQNELLLTEYEEMLLARMLEENYLPENRTYLYDFFHENCSTIPLAMVDSATNHRFSFKLKNYKPTSFVELTRQYLSEKPWALTGLNIAMGVKAQLKANTKETAFLPDYLYLLFKEASDEANSHLIGRDVILTEAYPTYFKTFRITPQIAFIILLILCLGLRVLEYQIGRDYKIVDYFIVGIPILIGFLFTSFWIFSDHYIYSWNHTLLWANPLFIIAFIHGKQKAFYLNMAFIISAIATTIIFDRSMSIILLILIIASRFYPVRKETT